MAEKYLADKGFVPSGSGSGSGSGNGRDGALHSGVVAVPLGIVVASPHSGSTQQQLRWDSSEQ